MLKNLSLRREKNINQVSIILENVKKDTISKLKIKKSRCAIYIPKNNDICYCGLSKNDHFEDALTNGSKSNVPEQWLPDKNCTKEDLDTDAYGEIKFENKDTCSKYIRVGQFTEKEKMIAILFKIWKLESPKLIISVTGGAKDFNLKPKLKNAFKRGLIKAALSTNAWITSGGNNVGVMKYVGEAIAGASLDPNKKLVVLGISNWGTLANKEQLINEDIKNSSTVEYSILCDKPQKNAFLDMNHTHFILVDNAQLNVFGGEVEFRTELEKTIANYKQDDKAQIVVLVLSGGEYTISTVKNSVENGSPCVFIEGSGGCADFFAYALSKSNENKSKKLDKELKNELEMMSKSLWPGKNASKIVSDLENVLPYSHLLSTFRIDSAKKDNEVDVAILRSLLKTQNKDSLSQLKLALTWDRIDIARDYIFTDDKLWKNTDLFDLMFDAISSNKPDFVEIFMENNCDINAFLTYGRLLKLYNDMPKNCVLYKQLIQARRNKSDVDESRGFDFKEIGNVVENLLDNLFKHSFSKLNLNLDQNIQVIKNAEKNMKSSNSDKSKKLPSINSPCVNPFLELFIYSILTDKPEMAKIFWNYNNEISSALVASKIFKEYDKFFIDQDETYNQLSDYFEKLAVNVLQSCFEKNQDDAQHLLLRQIPEFGNSTLFSMASAFECKNFVSTTCFQDMVAKLWYGQIYTDASWIRILVSMVFPLFSPLFLNLNFDRYKLNLEEMNNHAEIQKEMEIENKDFK